MIKTLNYAYSSIVTIVNNNFFYLLSLRKTSVGVYCSPDLRFKKAGLMGKKDKIPPPASRKKEEANFLSEKEDAFWPSKSQKESN